MYTCMYVYMHVCIVCMFVLVCETKTERMYINFPGWFVVPQGLLTQKFNKLYSPYGESVM